MTDKPSEKPGADWFMAEAEKAREGGFELVPGMREQGKKIKKVYVESDYAPLKAVYLANASGFHVPDMDIAWDMANMMYHNIPESQEYMRKHAGKFLGDSDPERFAKVVAESDALAKAYRDNGVYVIRNESGVIPEEQITFSESWSGQKLVGTYAQAAWEVVGNALINFWEVSAEMGVEFQAREAVVEFFRNDPEAKWYSMPFPVPTSWPDPGPRTSAGDIKIFDGKKILWGIGVADPKHMTDFSKARSSGDEFAAEMFRRMIEPLGWTVDIVYFDSNYTYHLDCLLAPLREGLLSYPKGSLWTPLPQWLRNWEVIDVSREDNNLGCSNNVPLGDNKVIVCEEAKDYCESLDKAGINVIPVPYFHIFNIIGSGVHCSSAAIHRES